LKEPSKHSNDHARLEGHYYGISYCELFGELLYAYITCCPDIGFALITHAKFSACPSNFHYQWVKGVAKYNQDRGIHFQHSIPNPSLPLVMPQGTDFSTLASFPPTFVLVITLPSCKDVLPLPMPMNFKSITPLLAMPSFDCPINCSHHTFDRPINCHGTKSKCQVSFWCSLFILLFTISFFYGQFLAPSW
jgi:hypothetical protein